MQYQMKLSVLTLACASALGGIAVAQAQDTARQDETVTLEAVIATAQKRSENIMEVPAGISVISEDRLETLNATQLTDFAAYVPGFQVDSGGAPGKVGMSLRGLAAIGDSAVVGTYIDETPLNSSNSFQRATGYALDLLPYDIESVEVLRGPQGTLYGASSMGGLFKYITKSGDVDNFEMRAGADVSTLEGTSDLAYGTRMAFNAPLVPGRLGLRASFARKETPGYIDNPVIGVKDYNGNYQLASRLALNWLLSENVSLRLQGLWQTVDSDSNAQMALDPVTRQPIHGDLTDNAAITEPYRNELNYYSAILDWDLGWGDFVSATSYSKTAMRQLQDVTAVYAPLMPLFLGLPEGQTPFDLFLGQRKWTQEMRLTSKPSDRFEWLVGGFYTHEDGNNVQILEAYDANGEYITIPGVNPFVYGTLPAKFRERALFADATYKFSPKFDVSLGARLARNDQVYVQTLDGALVAPGREVGASEETVDTYKLAARWHLNADSMLYARAATGFRPGGPNILQPGIPPTVDSDTAVNYELGWKGQFWGNRAMVDIAAFQVDWEDMKIIVVNDQGIGYAANAGTARSRGLELSSLFRVTGGLTLGLNGAYTDAVINDDLPDDVTATITPGRMPYVSRLSGAVTLDYAFDVGGDWSARIGGGYRHVGDRITTDGIAIDSYRALDLHADVSNLNWTVRLFVKNATDERAFVSIVPVTSAIADDPSYLRGIPIQPRTIGISVDYRY